MAHDTENKWQGGATITASEFQEDFPAAVDRLAALPPHEYEQSRIAEAKTLKVRQGFLDGAVKKAREGDDDRDSGFKLYEPEPWFEPIAGDGLLDKIVAAVRQYVVMPEHVAETAALWIVHTHGYEIWQVTPRFAISAPTMGSGKSVMLDVLSAMVPRALEAANLSTAVMFRAVEKYRPTLMIDEVDTFLRDNDELRGVLNSGHRKGGSTLRCEGDANDVKAFRTFAPIATAGIGKLPGTLADRSIRAELQRKKTNEHVAEFRSDRIDHLRELSRQTARWIIDNEAALREAEPKMPPGIFNRKADNWRPLLSIADAAGGDWPVRARAAAVALSETGADDAESLKVQLLSDIQAVFMTGTEDRIATKDLIAALHDMEERPWIDFRRGKPLTARQLGEMLRSFKVAARSMRFSDGRNAKGYPLSILQDVFSRYLGDSAVTPSQVNVTAGYSESCAVTSDTFVTAEKHEKPNVSAGCDVVTAKKGTNPTFSATLENLCVVCNQAIEADQETIPHGGGELHSHCYDEWFAAIPSR